MAKYFKKLELKSDLRVVVRNDLKASDLCAKACVKAKVGAIIYLLYIKTEI